MREPGFYWLIYFEDCRLNEELFTDESVARARLTELQKAWKCHLFQRIDGPRIPNAETIEKLWAVARAAQADRKGRAHLSRVSLTDIALRDALDALGPLPEEKKA